MFIFVRCLCSSAVVTPVIYQPDIVQVTSVFIILRNLENKEKQTTVYKDVFTDHVNPFPNFNGGLTKQPRNLSMNE